MVTVQQVEQALKDNKTKEGAARALGISRRQMMRILSKPSSQPSTPKQIEVVDKTVDKDCKDLSDFAKLYDKDTIIPAKIKAALAKVKTKWIYEVAFAKLAGVSLNDLGNYRTQFADYVVSIRKDNKRAWTGDKATAETMRSMIS